MAHNKEKMDDSVMLEMKESQNADTEKDHCFDEANTATMITETTKTEKIELTYKLSDVPTWYACIVLGLQVSSRAIKLHECQMIE